MAYWHRLAVGGGVGIVALGVLWFVPGVPWITALGAGLGAPIAFLATFFIWSADRPQDGYEQVLFDKPNNIVCLTFIVLFALGGLATGLGGDLPEPPRDLATIAKDYKELSDAFKAGSLDAAAATAKLDALKAEATAKPAGEARDFLVKAIDAQRLCVVGDANSCNGALDHFVNYRLAPKA